MYFEVHLMQEMYLGIM